MYKLYTNLCTIFRATLCGIQRDKASKVYNCFVYLFLILFLSPEVARSGAKAALDAGHALHLAMRHIVVELGIRSAQRIVTMTHML